MTESSIKFVEIKTKKRKVTIKIDEGNKFFYIIVHARRFRKPKVGQSEIKYKTSLYDERGNPIIPIRSDNDPVIRHPFQRPSSFTDKETGEILISERKKYYQNLKNESTKEKE